MWPGLVLCQSMSFKISDYCLVASLGILSIGKKGQTCAEVARSGSVSIR